MHKRGPSLFMHSNGSINEVEETTVLECTKEDGQSPARKAACCETAQVLADRIYALQELTASLSHAFSSA